MLVLADTCEEKMCRMLQTSAYLENIRIHWADCVLAHAVLVLAVKIVKEVDIVQRVLILHGKVNVVLT